MEAQTASTALPRPCTVGENKKKVRKTAVTSIPIAAGRTVEKMVGVVIEGYAEGEINSQVVLHIRTGERRRRASRC